MKRHFEYPQREFAVWCLDVSKQVTGYFISFVLDEAFGLLTREYFADGDDKCERLFMTYLYSCVFGVMFSILSIVCLTRVINHHIPYQKYKDIVKFGWYGEPFSWTMFFLQLGVWALIVTCGKLLVVGLFSIFTPEMGPIFRALLSVFSEGSQLKHILISYALPVVLTTSAVWVQDMFLKYDRAEDESLHYLVIKQEVLISQ